MDREDRLTSALRRLAGKKLLIYGAGGFGTETYELLMSHELRPSAFLDQRAEEEEHLYGLPVYRPDGLLPDGLKAGCTVLFAIVMDREERGKVLRFLDACGFKDLIEAQSLRVLAVEPDDQGQAEDDKSYYSNRKAKIEAAGRLFTDPVSRRIYETNVKAHRTRDYGGCYELESPMEQQYFPPDIPFTKGYGRLIDCGAYIGDTVEQVVKRQGSLEALAAFEPDLLNFQKLSNVCDGLGDTVGLRILYPCAVGGVTAMREFCAGRGSGKLAAGGGVHVQTVSLDMVLKGFEPAFIKMDIEGEELRALGGARRLIAESRPGLAVCVYHHVNHLWDIPLTIAGWNLGYHFYLRSYNAYTMETVLYATTG